MYVALGEPAGLGLGMLWALKMMAEWLLLGVGPSGERGYLSSLSICLSACGVNVLV